MNRFLFNLSSQLHFTDQQIGHDADIIRYHTPIHLCVKVRTTLPIATENIKASFKIRNDGFDAASPSLEPRLHMHAAGQIPKRSNDLVEHYEVSFRFPPGFLGLLLVPPHRNCSAGLIT